MRLNAVLPLVLAISLLTGGSVATPSADSSGCEGFTVYQKALDAARDDYLAGLHSKGVAPGTPSSGESPADLTILIDATAAYLAALTAIQPPAWAASWHTALLKQVGLHAQIAKATLSRGRP